MSRPRTVLPGLVMTRPTSLALPPLPRISTPWTALEPNSAVFADDPGWL